MMMLVCSGGMRGARMGRVALKGLLCRESHSAPPHTPPPSHPHMLISAEVACAVEECRPVVALETAILTHGMPYPDNLRTACEVEAVVRSQGVVPATVGVLDGQVHVGLTQAQLERLASPATKCQSRKVSRRDLAYAMSQGLCGGTTVAATMLCAHKAGVPLFVTGGIGGVHWEGETTLDVSADVLELGRTPVAVVCGGVKSILDIGRTLEVLETQGVPVVTYGSDKEFPAFFTPISGHQAEFNLKTPCDCAQLIDNSFRFGMESGILVAVPIPRQAQDIGHEVELAIQQALTEAKAQKVKGHGITPFVLKRVSELTKGKSLQANIELVRHNALVGSQIAVELSQLRKGRKEGAKAPDQRTSKIMKPKPVRSQTRRPAVIGASILDVSAKLLDPLQKEAKSNPGSVRQSCGGVGRNIAECLARLEANPFFVSAVGNDSVGHTLVTEMKSLGMDTSGVEVSEGHSSAAYCVFVDASGEVMFGVGDMSINDTIDAELVQKHAGELESASLVCLDANLPHQCIQYVSQFCWERKIPMWYEPTCMIKASKPILLGCHGKLTYASPNLSELRAMFQALTGENTCQRLTTELSTEEKFSECKRYCAPLVQHIPHLLVTLGRDGVVHSHRGASGGTLFHHYPPASAQLLPVDAINTTGAGDSFVGAMISCLAGERQHHSFESAVKGGLMAAYMSVKSQDAVSCDLCPTQFTETAIEKWAPWSPAAF